VKKAFLVIVLVFLLGGLVSCSLLNSDEKDTETQLPQTDFVPDGFKNNGIPIYLCDKNPLTHTDAVCWLYSANNQ